MTATPEELHAAQIAKLRELAAKYTANASKLPVGATRRGLEFAAMLMNAEGQAPAYYQGMDRDSAEWRDFYNRFDRAEDERIMCRETHRHEWDR